MNEKLNSMVNKVETLDTNLREKTSKLTQDTLWQIKECKDLVQTRISEQKVEHMVQAVYAKLDRELELLNTRISDRIQTY